MSTLPADGAIVGQRPLFADPAGRERANRACLGPQMRVSAEAGIAAIARKAVLWPIVPAEFPCEAEDLGVLIGVAVDRIAIMPSASHGLELAARTLLLECGQSVPVLHAIGQQQ